VKLGALLSQAKIPVPAGAEDRDVRAIAYDSRKVKEGSLFVAIPGFHRDGATFTADAAKNGAVAVVAERKVRSRLPVAVVPDVRAALADLSAEFFDHPTNTLRVVGVTGTDGKTTTVHLVSDVLEAAGERTGYATTVDFKLADHGWENDTRQSTQEALELQEFCAELLVAGGTWGVLEATSHALALRKLRGIDVDIAVFTNLSPEHLDFHGTLQSYLEAKGILTGATSRIAPRARASSRTASTRWPTCRPASRRPTRMARG
jgi:UDP-N-acetylmuramoyl-L-alanyl-D-glutamate--2,6-diaminopimelate ligase